MSTEVLDCSNWESKYNGSLDEITEKAFVIKWKEKGCYFGQKVNIIE